MRLLHTVLILVLLLWAAPALAQTAGPSDHIGFDYPDASFTSAAVTAFEMSVDSQPYTSVAIPPTQNDANTLPDHTTRIVPIPALTPGAHTVAFRARNVSDVGPASAAYGFTLVVLVAPDNIRIVSVTGGDAPPLLPEYEDPWTEAVPFGD